MQGCAWDERAASPGRMVWRVCSFWCAGVSGRRSHAGIDWRRPPVVGLVIWREGACRNYGNTELHHAAVLVTPGGTVDSLPEAPL